MNFVAGEDLDVMQTHFPGEMGKDNVSVVQLHAIHAVAQRFRYDAVQIE